MSWNRSQIQQEICSEFSRLESRVSELAKQEIIVPSRQSELDDKIGRLTFYEELINNVALLSKNTFIEALKRRLSEKDIVITDSRIKDAAKAQAAYRDECMVLLQGYNGTK